jgi:hypothetical protein
MDTTRIMKWLNNADSCLYPPGCEADFVSLPTGKQGSCTVGVVHEHRFAFFFWGLYSQAQSMPRPVLITLDSHNDVGVPSEVNHADLDNLNISNRMELGLFTWLGLRSNNDGHILPALYLDFFSDVYVLLNKDEDALEFQPSKSLKEYEDRIGKIHKVKFYRHTVPLLCDLPSEKSIYLGKSRGYL